MLVTTAYWDCPAGIAGDMCLETLVSAGVPLAYLKELLHQLGLDQTVTLRSELVQYLAMASKKNW